LTHVLGVVVVASGVLFVGENMILYYICVLGFIRNAQGKALALTVY